MLHWVKAPFTNLPDLSSATFGSTGVREFTLRQNNSKQSTVRGWHIYPEDVRMGSFGTDAKVVMYSLIAYIFSLKRLCCYGFCDSVEYRSQEPLKTLSCQKLLVDTDTYFFHKILVQAKIR